MRGYRAWDPILKKMFDVQSIDWFWGLVEVQWWEEQPDGSQVHRTRSESIRGEMDGIEDEEAKIYAEVMEVKLMKYTGLNDKNSKDIYEGDVLSVVNPNEEEDAKCIVEWDAEGGCYPYEPDGGYGDFDLTSIGWAMSLGFIFEVIGNIYDNPELLEVSNE